MGRESGAPMDRGARVRRGCLGLGDAGASAASQVREEKEKPQELEGDVREDGRKANEPKKKN